MSRSSMTPAECWSDLADKPAPLPWHRNERALGNEQVPDFWAVAHWVRQTPRVEPHTQACAGAVQDAGALDSAQV
jgi:hypothetical protein